MNNILSLIGLTKRAGRLEIGEAPVGAAARAHKARLFLLASDAAENTVRRAAHFAEGGQAPCLTLPFTKAELGATLGRSSCAMLAVTDIGFAANMTRKLSTQNPEEYGETADKLDTKAAKALLRQKEQLAHEKKLQRQTKNPWAPPTPSADKNKKKR
ncbi:MAG: 50S ribosomal protein L7 [Pseudoflavonifractor sp.]